MGKEWALEMQEVTVRYPESKEPALLQCSLRVGQGERVAVLGLNGSGKSTLLLTAVGMLSFSGQVRLLGEKLTSRTAQRLRGCVGFVLPVPEDQILLPRVLDDVAFTAIARGWPKHKAMSASQDMLDLLGVGELASSSPHRISHGQRLRVALAGALVTSPALLLLDEPTGGMDPLGRRQLAKVLASLPSAMLIATHDLEFASRTCSRYILLEQGRVVLEGRNWNTVDSMWDPGWPRIGVDNS